jgi:hypothetical protein
MGSDKDRDTTSLLQHLQMVPLDTVWTCALSLEYVHMFSSSAVIKL